MQAPLSSQLRARRPHFSAGAERRSVPRTRSAAQPRVHAEPHTQLRMFLDSASVTQWDLWLNTGIFYGFTTNPLILERDGVKCNLRSITKLAKTAFDLGVQELQVQAWGDDVQKLTSVAFDLAGINPKKVVVKLPCTLEGIQTASLLRDADIRVTITGVYSPQQVILAQSVGAEYAAPYLGRMNDAFGEGQGVAAVSQMLQINATSKTKMRLLMASVREASEISNLAALGCDTFTISPTVAMKLFKVGQTIDAVSEFEAAARRNGAYEYET
eukprot:gene14719-20760_t